MVEEEIDLFCGGCQGFGDGRVFTIDVVTGVCCDGCAQEFGGVV